MVMVKFKCSYYPYFGVMFKKIMMEHLKTFESACWIYTLKGY